MHATTDTSFGAALLAVATIAAAGLLALVAADVGSVLAWVSVPLPLVLAGGAGHSAVKAARRGDTQSASDLISLGITGNTFLAFLAGLAG